MRIIFMGTPDFAVPTLRALVEAGHELVAAYTQPPRPGGRRGKKLTKTPVYRAAEELGIEVRCPPSLKDERAQADFAALSADVAVVAAYGLILPRAVLDAPKFGCLNVHASLLPRWRGAAPIQRAILSGDKETGVTIMRMEAGLDTGAMLGQAAVAIGSKSAGELTARLARMGAVLMVEVIANLAGLPAETQDDALATYASKIDKAETRIDFTIDSIAIERQVRAFAPAPGAWFEFDGERYKVLEAQVAEGSAKPGTVLDSRLAIACGSGAIRPTLLQRAGKPVMSASDLLRGKPIPAGTVLE